LAHIGQYLLFVSVGNGSWSERKLLARKTIKIQRKTCQFDRVFLFGSPARTPFGCAQGKLTANY